MYAGKITESKGIYALAATLPYIEKKHENVELHIVGKSTKEERDKLMMEANYSEKLMIYNAENQKLMADHLRESDIFVLPWDSLPSKRSRATNSSLHPTSLD